MASLRINLTVACIAGVWLLAVSPTAAADPVMLGLPAVTFPADNPSTPEKIALGRKLFFDARLSVHGKMSCATCHEPTQGFATNGLPANLGNDGFPLKRNTPTVVNAALEPELLWNGAMKSLEALAWGPILAAEEMANTSVPDVIERIAALPDYAGLFERAFAGNGPGKDTLAQALASYERTLISGGSRFDRWWFGGDETAVNAEERRGAQLFMFRAGCAQCHKIDEKHAMFADGRFHDIGVAPAKGPPDPGRYEVTGEESDRGKFKTPSLRNVALTAPYMHDGSAATLEDVVDLYDRGGEATPNKAEWLFPLGLSIEDKRALVAFLKTLTGANAEALAQQRP